MSSKAKRLRKKTTKYALASVERQFKVLDAILLGAPKEHLQKLFNQSVYGMQTDTDVPISYQRPDGQKVVTEVPGILLFRWFQLAEARAKGALDGLKE